ncbi:hypothetical protein [Streptomyces sp. SID3343]|uniref:hypothetical protein n=1 Tax=Streptomyces sp. SID3343 TaxID=2690260 RepID=UPI001371130E|nr:hypothetical protein [Streptomyces sp. SID3343]MYV98755.1 hypothetical protein [Streptomyces sp. SID3343]
MHAHSPTDAHDDRAARRLNNAADIDVLAASMTGPDALADALHHLGGQGTLFAALDNLLLTAATRSRGVPDRDTDRARACLRDARTHLARAANDIVSASEHLIAPYPPPARGIGAAPRNEPDPQPLPDDRAAAPWVRPGPAATRAALAAARTTAAPKPEPPSVVRPAPWAAATATRHRPR